jgi:hypothetical protein
MAGGATIELFVESMDRFARVGRRLSVLDGHLGSVRDAGVRTDLANKGTMALLALVEMQRLMNHKIVVMAATRGTPAAYRLALDKAAEALRVQNRKLEILSKQLEKLIEDARNN